MRKLALVGTHQDTLELVPWDNPEVEIWTWNDAACFPWFKRWDVLLEIHGRDVFTRHLVRSGQNYWNWLRQSHGRPVYMQRVQPDVPDSVEYPLEQATRLLPFQKQRDLGMDIGKPGSSASLALLLAVHLGYTDIEVYGVELATNTEYAYQANNWRWLVGWVQGRGVNLELYSGLALFGGRTYGYEGGQVVPAEYFQRRQAELSPAVDITNHALVEAEFRALFAISQDLSGAPDTISAYQRAAIEAKKQAAMLKRSWECLNLPGRFNRQDYDSASQRAKYEVDQCLAEMYRAEGMVRMAWGLACQNTTPDSVHQLRLLLSEEINAAFKVGEQLGYYEENARYLAEIDSLSTAITGELTVKEMT